MQNRIAKWLGGMLALAMLAGCATPERTVSMSTWAGDGSTTRTLAMSHETGYQLFFGERSTMLTGPGATALDTIDKTTMGNVINSAIGAAVLGYAAGVPGAIVGGAGGYAIGPIVNKATTKTTTGTTTVKTETITPNTGAMQSLVGVPAAPVASADGSMIGLDALKGASGSSSSLSGLASLLQAQGLAVPATGDVAMGTPAATSALGNILKSYLAAHPEKCQLIGLIGEQRVMDLIDRNFGTAIKP